MRLPSALLSAAAVAAGLLAAGAADARMSIVYEPEASARVLFTGRGALSPERGGYRQDPGAGGVFREGIESHRVAKVRDSDLRRLSAAGMASLLRRAVDEAPSGLVAIDEIGNHWRDPRLPQLYKWVRVRGACIRIAAHNDVVVTSTGYRVVRREQVPPVPDGSHPGMRLSAAMEALAAESHRAGGSYADRIHVYVAPAMVTAVGEGRGRHFTLDATGSRSMRPAWRGVVRALALAGGVWLEMYHGDRRAVSARVWRSAPARFGRYLRAHGGEGLPRLHFLMTGSRSAPPGAPAGCGPPMACQFALAGATPAGRALLANGPGAYRVEGRAREWLAAYNRLFPD